jgi:predicted signal transduction protein with EAL and GGDEF domain
LESELWIAFQPIVDVLNNRVIAFEALARWHSAELGPIGPDVFIPIAERSQMIGRVTEILLAQALAAARHWPASIGLSFNLSAQDLITVDTMGAVRRIVAESGVAPSRIAFEVTETALLADFDQAVRAVDSLHALGASIALDDFGTGYSSLGYVQRLPLDKIKIDRRFVADADVNRTSANIVKIIVDLCRNLDLVCVVEGVETESQLRAIVSLGCRFVQGYVLSRPVAADAVLGLIEQIATAKSRQVFAG